MVEIREYNVSTGHVEVLATVSDAVASDAVTKLLDGSTDHVIYAITIHAGSDK